jgi:hypothetical protein
MTKAFLYSLKDQLPLVGTTGQVEMLRPRRAPDLVVSRPISAFA